MDGAHRQLVLTAKFLGHLLLRAWCTCVISVIYTCHLYAEHI